MPSPKIPTARTIANRKARVIMNRGALDELQLSMADGLLELGQRIVAEAAANARHELHPAEAATRREKRGVPMMADTGHVVVYALGKKVGGEEGETGKPRGMETPKDQAVLGVWFSSPLSHFKELGTVKETARPFLTPALMGNIGDTGPYVQAAMKKRAASAPQRAMRSAEIKARIAAGG
jgi:hypothetical protein